MKEMFDFIFAHAGPGVFEQPVGRPANTPAQEWLVKCALLSEDNLEDDFQSIWTSYLTQQPHYTAPLFNLITYHAHHATTFSKHALTGTFPGLQRALHALPNDPEAQHLLLREYWRLGATASALWEHVCEEHDIQRGQPLPSTDFHLNAAREEIRSTLRRDVRDWASTTPLRVRRVLAQCDMEADLVFLVNHVFPLVIAPAGSAVCEGAFGWLVWLWVNGAARGAGMVVWDAAFDDDGDGPLFFRPYGGEEYLSYRAPGGSAESVDEVDLEPFGPAIDVFDYAYVPLRLLSDETCTICMEGLDESEDSVGAVKLQVCGHVFHSGCLGVWMNASHSTPRVACPNYKAKICKARPRRVPQP